MFYFVVVYVSDINIAKYGIKNAEPYITIIRPEPTADKETLSAVLKKPFVFRRAVTGDGILSGMVTENDIKDSILRKLRKGCAELDIRLPHPLKTIGDHMVKINDEFVKIEICAL